MIELEQALSRMGRWHADQLAQERPPVAGGLLMGAPLWGEQYIVRFVRFGLPSLLEPANREALQGARLVLYTDAASLPLLKALAGDVRPRGLDLEPRLIPAAIAADAVTDRRLLYALLGTVHCILRHEAGGLGADYHVFQPDHLYGRAYFPRLRALGRQHPAIAQSGLSVSFTGAAADLEALRAPDGTLAIEPRALGALGLRHLHPQMHWMTMNAEDRSLAADRLPQSTWLAWRGRDAMWIFTPHRHPVFLSAALCRAAPVTAPHTIDTRLPDLARRFYTPRPADGLVFVELSASEKQHDPRAVPFSVYANTFWRVALFNRAFLRQFLTPTRVAVERDPAGASAWRIRWEAGRLGLRLAVAQSRITRAFVAQVTGRA